MSSLTEIRFRLDDPELYDIGTRDAGDLRVNIDKQFSLRHVRIVDGLFPTLDATIKFVFESLKLEHSYDAFVSADETINASCIAGRDGVTIWLSSGLVKTLDDSELAFVIGHEVGHWYLGHHLYDKAMDAASPRFRLVQCLSRAAEISADRFGLLAVGDIEVALRAIIKTASGLTSEYLGPTVIDFLQQARDIKSLAENVEEIYATHPPMVIRARALLWFSMSEAYNKLANEQSGGDPMSVVDKRVEDDLTAALGQAYSSNREEDFMHYAFWVLVNRLGSDGTLTKSDQKTIADSFGHGYLDKLTSMFSGMSKQKVREEILARAKEASFALDSFSKSETETFLDNNSVLRDALGNDRVILP